MSPGDVPASLLDMRILLFALGCAGWVTACTDDPISSPTNTGADVGAEPSDLGAPVDAGVDDASLADAGGSPDGASDGASDGGQPMGMGPEPIQGQSTTVLPDGRVLIVGGRGTATSQSESWLLDLSTLTFAAGPAVSPPRNSHSATLLANGKVLIAGGVETVGANRTDTASALLFDPATDTFAPAGELGDAQCCQRAITLSAGPHAGKVLFVGGGQGGSRILPLELYDPVAETFSRPGPALPAPRDTAAYVELEDGRILIAGGAATPGNADIQDTALVIEPMTLTLQELPGRMSKARSMTTGFRLPSGQVLILPGSNRGSIFDDCEIFDPATGTFSAGPTLGAVRTFYGSGQLMDGRVFIFGGQVNREVDDGIEVYDGGDRFVAHPEALYQALAGVQVTPIPGGAFLLLSGQAESGFIAGQPRIFYP